jgi:site-specific recombinase XerC
MSFEKSLAGLSDFLDYLSDKGLMPKETAMSRKSTVNSVLSVLPDSETQDVTAIDVDDVMRRFQNRHSKKYTPGSLKTYRSRLAAAIEDFITYNDNPMAFRPATTVRERKPRETRVVKNVDSNLHVDKNRSQGVESPANASGMMVPIPIRSDLTIQIKGLPFDLTPQEAKKIAGVIMAMATEPVQF